MTPQTFPESAGQVVQRRSTLRIRLSAAGIATALAVTAGVAATVTTNDALAAAPPTPTGWTQNFLEDFNGGGLSGNWRIIEGTSYPGGPANFGTGEVETSTAAAVSVAGGIMSITARGQGMGPWTAARIETNRQDFRPPPGGKLRVEASLKLPEAPNGQSAGYWPAFWMLGGPYRGNWWNWPMVGEFDIMENVNGANRIWSTVHCGTSPGGPCNEKSGVGNGGPVGCQPTACTKGFHRYTIDWSAADSSATFYLDGRQTWRVQRGGNIPAAIWDQAFGSHGFFIILNIAMGGEMPANTPRAAERLHHGRRTSGRRLCSRLHRPGQCSAAGSRPTRKHDVTFAAALAAADLWATDLAEQGHQLVEQRGREPGPAVRGRRQHGHPLVQPVE